MSAEREKMLRGELYDAADPQLVAERLDARELLHRFNHSSPVDEGERLRLLAELFGHAGEGLWIEPPFFCDYGSNIRVGDRVYFNFNCVVLDPAPVTIGSDVL